MPQTYADRLLAKESFGKIRIMGILRRMTFGSRIVFHQPDGLTLRTWAYQRRDGPAVPALIQYCQP